MNYHPVTLMGRLLCALGFHDWVSVRRLKGLSCYLQHCARANCWATRLDR